MPGRVENIDHAVLVFELQDGGGNGDAALLFHLHPVGGGGTLVFLRGDGAGQLERAAVEEEFFRQGRFPRIGVGDDREGTAA